MHLQTWHEDAILSVFNAKLLPYKAKTKVTEANLEEI